MDVKIKKLNLVYRKLNISDYPEFKKLFNNCFKRNISIDFFKWRYLSDKFSFCYGAFYKLRLIANVGMISIKLNNKENERIISRHSSMVLKKYRGYGVFSDLLKRVKKKISKNIRIVAMWPNKNNFSNFSIQKKKVIKKKYYLYETLFNETKSKITKNYDINDLKKFKKFIENNNSFFLKDYSYFKNRYLLYNKNNYLINKYTFKKFTSFYILKFNKKKTDSSYVILDHFGSGKIKSKHFLNLIKESNELIFLSQKKIYKSNFKLLNFLYFKIGFIKRFNSNYKKSIFHNKEIFLGDTDIFITI